MKTTVTIEHESINVESNFEEFTFYFEKALGILTPMALDHPAASPASSGCYLVNTGNDQQLVLFNILEQKDLMQTHRNVTKLKQYQIGNQEISRLLACQDAGAALYMPLRLLVYENTNKRVIVEYELPSSQLARFNNSHIRETAAVLDWQLTDLIRCADHKEVK